MMIAAPTSTRETSHPGTSPQILIVDDEPGILGFLRRALTRSGFSVTEAGSLDEALKKVGLGAFDVVISDLHIGTDNGFDLLRSSHSQDPDVPFVMITGLPEVQSAIRAVELGAFRYLVKPFGIEDLQRVIADAISARSTAVTARRLLAQQESEVSSRRTLAASYNRALEALYLVYQPIVRWSSKSTYAYEALMRTSEPALPNPGAILDAGEKLDRLTELGRQVRRLAAEDAVKNPSDRLFINLHAADLLDDKLYDPSASLSGIADQVVLEITERFALHQVDDIAGRVARLRELGFKLAIDDLGEGYAGLASLGILEPDVIKLDMSIVRDVDASKPKQRLIRSMVELAQESGMELIAEGVETQAELSKLVELGCDLFQGYLFAKPGQGFPKPSW